jgi:hypothetical protein
LVWSIPLCPPPRGPGSQILRAAFTRARDALSCT